MAGRERHGDDERQGVKTDQGEVGESRRVEQRRRGNKRKGKRLGHGGENHGGRARSDSPAAALSFRSPWLGLRPKVGRKQLLLRWSTWRQNEPLSPV